jgi:hypothetical protein
VDNLDTTCSGPFFYFFWVGPAHMLFPLLWVGPAHMRCSRLGCK